MISREAANKGGRLFFPFPTSAVLTAFVPFSFLRFAMSDRLSVDAEDEELLDDEEEEEDEEEDDEEEVEEDDETVMSSLCGLVVFAASSPKAFADSSSLVFAGKAWEAPVVDEPEEEEL